eukprot:COSAG01_NODE_61927_length_287_cov_0.803191_1_plen_78_part_10
MKYFAYGGLSELEEIDPIRPLILTFNEFVCWWSTLPNLERSKIRSIIMTNSERYKLKKGQDSPQEYTKQETDAFDNPL